MKRILLTVAVICAGFAVRAQVNFGIKGGANLSSLGGYEYPVGTWEESELQNRVGVYAGLFSQIYIAKNWGIETGLYFNQLGGQERERDFDEQYDVKARANYLQLPVSAFYRFRLNDKISIYPSLGVYGAYGLSGNIKSDGQVMGADIKREEKYFDEFANRLDFGGTAGIQVGLGKLLLGAAYDQGITRVNKQKVRWDDDAYNSNFRLTIGFKF